MNPTESNPQDQKDHSHTVKNAHTDQERPYIINPEMFYFLLNRLEYIECLTRSTATFNNESNKKHIFECFDEIKMRLKYLGDIHQAYNTELPLI